MPVEHFIVIASAVSDIYLINALSARQAHDFAANEFRKRYSLAPNIHVLTATAFRSSDEDEAKRFMEGFISEMDREEEDEPTELLHEERTDDQDQLA